MEQPTKKKFNVEASRCFLEVEAKTEQQAISIVEQALNSMHYTSKDFYLKANEV